VSTWAAPSYTEWAVPGYSGNWLLGHGVAGTVVAAVNDSNGQRVAIKYLNEDLVHNSEFLAEFRVTAEQLISLNAPHVAGVFDYAEQPGVGAAIVTELVEGVSLRKMITRRGPLSAKAALVVLKDSLLGLAAGHSRRVAHRDVKPDNVLIDANGWCTLTDFGLAVQADKQLPVPGTAEYMAPELWNGAPNFPATDMYAATVMLCESLTGKPPFTGRAGRLREQHESEPVPLDQYDPPLRDLIGWGMAKYSDRRPPSAWAFAGELDARAADAYGPNWEDEGRRELAERARELLALPEGDGGDSAGMARRARRSRLVALASVAAVVIVVLGAAGALALSKKLSAKAQPGSVAAADVSAAITGKTPTLVSKCSTPSTFAFTGSITDQQPGQVSYQWNYSTGQNGPVERLNFATAGTQQVTGGTLTTGIAGDGWARLTMLLNSGTKASNIVT
jgi:eukaryotic-like serine/threonine-protein kinase